ncbi:hypothetical protein I4U23_007969 [Adineta vaga]|nr:hypothetical protein I4U23_007969 [Adineta vaga]
MSSMRSGSTSGSHYPYESRSNTQPMNYTYNQPNPNVERRTNPALTVPANRTQQNTSNNQETAIPQSLYVQRRSTNPVPIVRPNQPQYVEQNKPNISYQNVQPIQGPQSVVYPQNNPGTPTRRVNPALTARPSRYATQNKESGFYNRETLGEIDDSPIIDPSAFRYLNSNSQKSQNKPSAPVDGSGIDTRPIINLDAVTQLEKRRQQQIEKNNRVRGDDGSGPGIDGRPIVDLNAFRHIEAKKNKSKDNEQQGQSVDYKIDDRPITNPDAFKYLESRREPKSSNISNESTIDTRPIINPDAFKYLEKRRENSGKDHEESGIDYKPIVNPDAFRYLEQRGAPVRRDIESGIDTKPMVSPDAFKYIERKGDLRPEITESTIDYRPIVNPKAFKWIEKKDPKPKIDDGPDVDERSYINPQAFQYIDRRPGKKSDECKSEIDTRSFILEQNPNALAHLERAPRDIVDTTDSGIDQRSYVNPNAFKYLEGIRDDTPKNSVHSAMGPSIDTKPYVNSDSFRHLEGQERPRTNDNDDRSIDDRSFVPIAAFRHLEFTGELTNSEQNDYLTEGQTDF